MHRARIGHRSKNSQHIEHLETRRLLAFVVNTTIDETDVNGTTSLREAIQLASANTGDDHITFDTSVFSGSGTFDLELSNGQLNYTSSSGKLYIDAPVGPTIAVNGDDSYRIFEFGANANVVLNNLTIREGFTESQGGGILNAGTLLLNACTLTENQANAGFVPGGNAAGGAIYNSGKLTIQGTTLFSLNSARGGDATATQGTGGSARGGAIFNVGELTISSGAAFDRNSAIGGDGAYKAASDGGNGGSATGGALVCDGTVERLTGVDFTSNLVSGGAGADADDTFDAGNGGSATGGALTSFSQDIVLVNVDFRVNHAVGGDAGSGTNPGDGGSALGGAINMGDTLSITRGEIEENTCTGGDSDNVGGNGSGGAIHANDGALSIDDVHIFNNQAIAGGSGAGVGARGAGGALTSATATVIIKNSVITGNAAIGGHSAVNKGGEAIGGAIASFRNLSITSTAFGDNTAIGADGVVGNEGTDGGNASGGAIYFGTGNMEITTTTFDANSVASGAGGAGTAGEGGAGGRAEGGAMFITGSGATTISSSSFTDNSAIGSGGGDTAGATYGGDGGSATGGAIRNSALTLTITDTSFKTNSALGGKGGEGSIAGSAGSGNGAAIFSGSGFSVSASTFDQNYAVGGASDGMGGQASGGAINGDGPLAVQNVQFTGNTVTGGKGGTTGGIASGGAIKHEGPGFTLTDSLVHDNHATSGNGGLVQGGGIRTFNSIVITRTTISNNVARGGAGADGTDGQSGGVAVGGGLYLNGTATIIQSTISENASIGGAGGSGSSGAGGDGGRAIAGGLYASFTVNIQNSTIYRNGVGGGGGGGGVTTGGAGGNGTGGGAYVDDDYILNAINVTFASNSAIGGGGGGGSVAGATGTGEGGGIFKFGSDPASLNNTIVADNSADTAHDLSGLFVLVNSLISSPSGDYTALPGSANNLLDTDPKLGLLQNNGGPTATSLPNPASPAINAGDNAAALAAFGPAGTDQRGSGFTRFVGVVDIGAVEVSNVIRVNFQPEGAPLATGFLGDFGKVYAARGNGQTYGWNQSITSGTRDRNLLADQARDTLVHMQAYGTRTWEIAVPNGAYQIHIVAGDAQWFNSIYKINAEGVLAVSGTPSSGNRFIEGTQTVVVTDGKLTISNATGSSNNKIDFIEITPVSAVPVKVNFQTSGSATPPGYLADSGQIFGSRGNGQSYGWNLNASSFSRDRDAGLSLDQRYDTLIHTQVYGNRTWELAVPNGTYSVKLIAGDPSWFNSLYKFNLEGELALSGTPTSGSRWIEGTKVVTVSDGKLTLSNAAGSNNNKIAFIEVTPL